MPRPPTTAALHTPPGRAGIAVIWLAGPNARAILGKVFVPLRSHARAAPGALQLGRLVDGGQVVDEAIVATTGEAAEINIHGGSAVAVAAMKLLARCGATILPAPAAAPGGFQAAHPTWDNPAIGREMLAALPEARTVLAAAAVTRQWAAGLSELAWGNPTAAELRRAARALATMQRILFPAEVVLAGPPNVGKSSLMNALAGRCVSIVHDTPGTTRDWVREAAALDGLPVNLTDTAGLWDAPGAVDGEAVRRARARAEAADLVCLLSTAAAVKPPPWLHAGKTLYVAAKCDLHPAADNADLAVSAVTGEGLEALRAGIISALGLAGFDPAAPMAFTPRQAAHLAAAAAGLDNGQPDVIAKQLGLLLRGPS